MSSPQGYDFASGNVNDQNQQPIATGDTGEPGNPNTPPSGFIGAASGAVGNIGQVASNAVKQGADAVVNAGKGVLEMGGSVISGLKRGFSKSSESGGE